MKVLARQLRLVTLLTVGLCGLAHAQTPDFSLPPLPGLPGAADSATAPVPLPPHDGSATLPSAQASPVDKEKPKQSQVAALPDAIPELADLPTPSVQPLAPAEKASATPAETATTEPETKPAPPLNVAPPPTTLPGLNLPLPPASVADAKPALPGVPSLPTLTASTLPEVDVEAIPAKPARKTWQTSLAPSSVDLTPNFNYRRQVLPDAIYRQAYDRANTHLPPRVTVEDYDNQLRSAIARNDVNATRALLNERRSLNLTQQGQGLITLARNYGATDTERLLIARGATR